MSESNVKPLIQVKNLKKYFTTPAGYLHAVDDVTFDIPEGKTMGVVGESGCGKSTLGRTLLRLDKPTSGEILFRGKDIVHINKKDMKTLRPKIQMVFQDPYASLNGHMTVRQLIAEPLLVNKICKNRNEVEEKPQITRKQCLRENLIPKKLKKKKIVSMLRCM